MSATNTITQPWSSQLDMARKWNKRHTDTNEELKLPLFADAIMVYIESQGISKKEKKSFELISALSKFTDNKINIQKSIATMEKN